MANIADTKGIHLGTVEGFAVTLHRDIKALQGDWLRLEADRTSCIYQHYEWVRIALATIDQKNEPCLLAGADTQGVQFILPLVMEKGTFYNTLRWAGGTHANLCSGLYSRNFLKHQNGEVLKQVFSLLGKSLSGQVIARLGNQRFDIDGFRNPMLSFPHQISVNRMYDMDISSEFESVLQIGNAKRKRKIFRRQCRLAEENGGYEFSSPSAPEDINAALETFFVEKTRRLKVLGAPEVFNNPETQEFIRTLAHRPMENGVQPFRIFELKIGGRTRAMYGCGIYHDYCQSSVNCVTYDELAHLSPGEMVLYLMIEHLCKSGFKKLDLGLGDERYKRSWCKTGSDLFDTVIPLTAAAVPHVFAIQGVTGLKRFIRRNDFLWQPARRVRQALASLRF